MTSGFRITGFTPYCATTYAPTCGNGIVETGEDCDDTSACCVKCKFKSGGVCSPGSNGENLCQFSFIASVCRTALLLACVRAHSVLLLLLPPSFRLRLHVPVPAFERVLRHQVVHRCPAIVLPERCVHCQRV